MYNQSEDKISSSVELQEIVDTITGLIDPAKLVKLKLSTPEEYIIKNGPNQPDKSVLTCTSTTRQCLWKERSCHMKPLYNRLLKAQQSCLELCFEIHAACTKSHIIHSLCV